MVELTKTTAAVANVSAAAQRLIEKAQNDAAALSQAQTDLAHVDDTVSSAVQAVADSISAVAPAPAESPSVGDAGASAADPATVSAA